MKYDSNWHAYNDFPRPLRQWYLSPPNAVALRLTCYSLLQPTSLPPTRLQPRATPIVVGPFTTRVSLFFTAVRPQRRPVEWKCWLWQASRSLGLHRLPQALPRLMGPVGPRLMPRG